MRIFIAFPLPQKIKELAVTIQNQIQELDKHLPIKWSRLEMLHLTLEFLGELSAEKVESVKEILLSIIPHYRFPDFETTTLDGFPNASFPHILFLGVKRTTERTAMLHSELVEKLYRIGIESEHHEWHTHITLGRIKREWHNPYDLSSFSIQKEVWNSESVQLMESLKKESEYEYLVLDQYFFKK